MKGTESQPGVIPLAMQQVFQTIKQVKSKDERKMTTMRIIDLYGRVN